MRGERSSQNPVDPWHARPAIEASNDTPMQIAHQLDRTSNGQYSSLWPQPHRFLHFLSVEFSPNRDRRVSGKFTNGQLAVTRCFNLENTWRREAGTNPLRVRATYISFPRHSSRRSVSQSRVGLGNSRR